MATILWCWRCRGQFPMLDPHEHEQLWASIKGFSGAEGKRMNEMVCDEYERLSSRVCASPPRRLRLTDHRDSTRPNRSRWMALFGNS